MLDIFAWIVLVVLIGSTVAVVMASADGYADGQPAAGIQKGQSLVFSIKILNTSN